MAAIELTPSLSETISSLDLSKIPDKLRCPICDKFLLNGYKSSCCDQAICESCYGEVSGKCPMCEHEPFSQDLCKPYKAIRNTAKAFLKTYEKRQADEKAKAVAATVEAAKAPTSVVDTEMPVEKPNTERPPDIVDDKEFKEEDATPTISELPIEDQPQPTIEASNEFQRPSESTEVISRVNGVSADANGTDPNEAIQKPQASADVSMVPARNFSVAAKDVGSDSNGLQNMLNAMNMNPGNMDMNQMMHFMSTNGMAGFNPMMGMPGMPNMGMNPMSQGMFGAFGGTGAGMNGMNGMNMGMNFAASQGMYGGGWAGQNNNMWNGPQNNNPSAFSNGMGGDFGPSTGYGHNVSQQGNFQQQQYPNDEFQNGHYGRGYGRGRGRGRGRGGFDRGRGSFSQYPQGTQPTFQSPHEQQQYEIQNMQASMTVRSSHQLATNGSAAGSHTNDEVASKQADDEFAPGGQEEVQEALGGDYNNAAIKDTPVADTPVESAPMEVPEASRSKEHVDDFAAEPESTGNLNQPIPVASPTAYNDETLAQPSDDRGVVAAHQEIQTASMPPPSAPLGPAAQFTESVQDFGFRGRGHGRFGSKGRGSVPLVNGTPASPAKVTVQSPVSPNGGTGVVGAPTGPKAMRESSATARSSRGVGSNGGFQIVGRASMAPQKSQSVASERSRSGTPVNGYDGLQSPSPCSSRRPSHPHRHDNSQYEAEVQDDHERDRERHRRRLKRDERDDYNMQDASQRRERSPTPEESSKSSHRSHREKDRHSSRHHSSRSRRHRDDVGEDYPADDRGISSQPSKDATDPESRTSHRGHRSGKSSKNDDRERERERDRDREERHRDRKRSRHDREKEEAPIEDDEAHHRSRRHKTHHDKEEVTNGRSSHRSSDGTMPAVTESVDPHTLEREARNKERMLKEQQRREKASKGGDSGRRTGAGRRVSYKYEDETRSSMVEQEREAARWR